MNANCDLYANQRTLNSAQQLGLIFEISAKTIGKVSEIFAQGFNYHSLDLNGNCIKGQQYMLKSDFNHRIIKMTEE